MRAGELRDLVTIEQRSIVSDGLGGHDETWATLATVWASIGPARGREPFVAAAGQRVATITHSIRMYYRDDLTPDDCRITHGGRVYDIVSVADPSRRRELIVADCVEKVT